MAHSKEKMTLKKILLQSKEVTQSAEKKIWNGSAIKDKQLSWQNNCASRFKKQPHLPFGHFLPLGARGRLWKEKRTTDCTKVQPKNLKPSRTEPIS